MHFAVSSLTRPDGPIVWILEDGQGGRAEVCPTQGFNCFAWQSGPFHLLYADPAFFPSGRPTRSGIPVLFPFPNRIRDGRFTWEGKEYQLPPNDPAGKNAIHGFACRRPWRVVGHGADAGSAWVTGAFRCSTDDPGSLSLWPADHEIELTLRLGNNRLRLEATVRNPDKVSLPFGLGYHPYFRLPFTETGDGAEARVKVPASEVWVLAGSLPTGQTVAVDAPRDLNAARRFGDLQLDDVLTALPVLPATEDGLMERARIEGGGGKTLSLRCAEAFRELVVFTPPHRSAFCVEPYTCPTDAINLEAQGFSVGWQVLEPGESWSAVVELCLV